MTDSNPFWTLRTVLLYTLCTLVAGVTGVFLGSLYTTHKPTANANLESRQNYLEQNIHDIRVGWPFPDVLLLDPRTDTIKIRTLLPYGGLVAYVVGDCQSCITTVKEFSKARLLLGSRSLPAIIISGGDNKLALNSLTTEESTNIVLVRDAQWSLSKDYGVVSFPSYFVLDENQVVQRFGVIEGTCLEFTELLTH